MFGLMLGSQWAMGGGTFAKCGATWLPPCPRPYIGNVLTLGIYHIHVPADPIVWPHNFQTTNEPISTNEVFWCEIHANYLTYSMYLNS